MILGSIALLLCAIAGVLLAGHVRQWWPASSVGGATTGAVFLVTSIVLLGSGIEFAVSQNDLGVPEAILGSLFGVIAFLAVAVFTSGPWCVKVMLQEAHRSEPRDAPP